MTSNLPVYNNPDLWPSFHEKLFEEYKNNPAYIACRNAHAHYNNLIKQDYTIYYKLTNYSNSSRGFKYNPGINVDTNEFKPFGCCSGGGLYFCKLEDLYQFRFYGRYLTPIIVPKDIPIYQETHDGCKHNNKPYNKLKAPCIYQLPRIKVDDEQVNQFISNASIGNNQFKNYMLYKSEKFEDIQHFVIFTTHDPYWKEERALMAFKRIILAIQAVPYNRTIYRKKIMNFPSVRLDKIVINFLLSDVFPELVAKREFKSIPISSLYLNPGWFQKLFTTDEIKLFRAHRVVVAGSSVLKYITGSNFSPNDIDIYINKNDMDQLIKSDYIVFNKKSISNNNFYNMRNIVGVHEIITKVGKKFQLIVVETKPAEFIRENFDFDLCAIGYDFSGGLLSGSFVNVIDKLDYSVLTIQPSYINKMCGSEIDGYSKYRARKTLLRMKKYINRGFTISNWKEFLTTVRDKMC